MQTQLYMLPYLKHKLPKIANPPSPEAGVSADSDHESLMDQCADECMQALINKDKVAFRESLSVLMADLLQKMQSSPNPKE